ncbi:MAG TPA: MlaD family protein [Streptosporangiaceae bacterium]|nr:MlaD family protein [Streptosporangiaceae bacterium]
MRLYVVLGGAIALVIAGVWFLAGNTYTVKVAMPSATNIVNGGTVQLNGFEVGSVSSIQAQENQAILELKIDRDYAPLHEGAVVLVPYKALLGERVVDITDGPSTNAVIPNHGLIVGQMPKPTEFDQILNTLDRPTLDHLKSLVNGLDDTVKGHESDVNATLQASGPALQALGGVLDAIGTDGPAIRALVTRLNELTGTVANHQADVRTVVTQLTRLTTLAASRQQQLRDSLSALPPTLETAKTTLDKVPPVAHEVVPLLHDLDPATEKLKDVAGNLHPLLKDLRPALHDLRPTISALNELFDNTPGLLDSTHETFDPLTKALDNLSEPLDFLRPYTPEAIGWLSNWNSAFANYDSNGHFARIFVQAGSTSLMGNPGVVPPGVRVTPYPAPGQNGGTPWTDAFGSGVR